MYVYLYLNLSISNYNYSKVLNIERFKSGSILHYLVVLTTLETISMKHKLSITLDEEIVNEIIKTLSSGKFRNKSHVVEYAVKKLLEVENGR